jgi:DNA-binding GntR family transcriptional regulator
MNLGMNEINQDFSNLNIIKSKSLSDIAVDMIRQEIIVGRLLPGSHVTEKNITDKLEISRMVAREAMIRLTKEGLLYKERNKYTKVIELSKKDISDIFDLRIALEVAAANKCIELDLDIFQMLKTKSEDVNRLANEKKVNEIENLVRNDMDFHELIVKSAGNQKLINIWEGLSSQILVLLYKYVINRQEQHNEASLSYDHSEIIEAFIKKDMQYMQSVMTEHIRDTKLSLLDNY